MHHLPVWYFFPFSLFILRCTGLSKADWNFQHVEVGQFFHGRRKEESEKHMPKWQQFLMVPAIYHNQFNLNHTNLVGYSNILCKASHSQVIQSHKSRANRESVCLRAENSAWCKSNRMLNITKSLMWFWKYNSFPTHEGIQIFGVTHHWSSCTLASVLLFFYIYLFMMWWKEHYVCDIIHPSFLKVLPMACIYIYIQATETVQINNCRNRSCLQFSKGHSESYTPSCSLQSVSFLSQQIIFTTTSAVMDKTRYAVYDFCFLI